ncbi:multidrug ABC transporter ATP-binding protein [Tenuifilaceae bacterium CYCD]|nr:multidrug ABC transporter ATP-binding protein [Tenuifilaceae bacterium CYCD]
MILKIQNFSKTYPNGVQALKNVNLEITTGMFGLVGPNGAGKSTLMRTLATLQEADSGSAFLDDLDMLNNKPEVRKILGYLPQEFGLYPKVSAETLLNHIAEMKGISNASERKELVKALLNKTNLYQHRNKNLGGFSGGMKQRFGIAQALIGSPKLIIVDEPTAGLDPTERNRFHNLLSEIGENVIVILSTHIIEDVKSLCNQMAIINFGEVLLQGKPDDIVNVLNGKVYRKLIDKHSLEDYRGMDIISSRLLRGKLEITVVNEINPENGFSLSEPSLDDVYFSNVRNTN